MARRSNREEPAVSIPSPEADALVAVAKGGDVDAFASLYRACLPMVFGNLYGRCGDRALAEDLTSEAFLKAMRSLDQFEGTSGGFLAWVLRIARNLFLDHVKSGRVKWESVVDEMPVRPALSSPETEALDAIEAQELREALRRLTAEQQEVVYLRFLQGLPISDVARIMGRAEGAIKALQFRALRSLARVLRDFGSEP